MKLNKKGLLIGCSLLGIGATITSISLPLVSCSTTWDGKYIFKLSDKKFNEIQDVVVTESENVNNSNKELLTESIKTKLNAENGNSIDSIKLNLNKNDDNAISSIEIDFIANKIDIRKVKALKYDPKKQKFVTVESYNKNFTWNDKKNKNVVTCKFSTPIETNFSNINSSTKLITLDESKVKKTAQNIRNTIKSDSNISITKFNQAVNEKKEPIAESLGIELKNISKIWAQSNSVTIYPESGFAFKIDSTNSDKNDFFIDTNGALVINNVEFNQAVVAPIKNDSLLFEPISAANARTISVNVGMGDAEIIQTSADNIYGNEDDFVILIDGGTGGSQGGKESSSPNGVSAVSSALNWLNVKDIDLFVISHPHNDHMYGLPEIIMNYAKDDSKALIGIDAWNKKVNSGAPTVVMKKVAAALEKKNVETFDSVQIVNDVNSDKDLTKNEKWQPANLVKFVDNEQPIGYFSVLGCTEKMNSNSMNEYSVSNIFEFNKHKELFAGDSEGTTDKKLMEYYNTNVLKSDIYKVSHHGSATQGSNSIEWIEAIKPKYAIISSGAEDDYTLPDKATLENLIKAGVEDKNILGTQPFGKSFILYASNNNDDDNTETWKQWEKINDFLKQHPTINNNNHGASIQKINGSYKEVSEKFVDLNDEKLTDPQWTTVDGYYNMVMKGIGIVFDFSEKNNLKLNKVDNNSVNSNAWKPNDNPIGPDGKWIKLSSADYKQNSGIPIIVKLGKPNSLRNREK